MVSFSFHIAPSAAFGRYARLEGGALRAHIIADTNFLEIARTCLALIHVLCGFV
jgi:hypothetical protein